MSETDAPVTDDASTPVVDPSPAVEPAPKDEPTKPEPKAFDEAYVKQLRSEAARYRSEAKTAAEELEKLRVLAMTQEERARFDAKAEGRREAISEFGSKLVDAELRAVSAGRLSENQMRVLVQGLNRSAFLLDDGSVDEKSVRAFVDGLAPPPPEQELSPQSPQFPDLGQGVRGQSPALNSNEFEQALRRAVGAPRN